MKKIGWWIVVVTSILIAIGSSLTLINSSSWQNFVYAGFSVLLAIIILTLIFIRNGKYEFWGILTVFILALFAILGAVIPAFGILGDPFGIGGSVASGIAVVGGILYFIGRK